MLKTIESYIGDESRVGLSQSLPLRLRQDSRFSRLAIASAIFHLLFYGVLIWFGELSYDFQRPGTGGVELVLVAELGAPPDKTPLRQPIRPRDNVDLSRLQYDPSQSDDINLVERSRKLGEPSGSKLRASSPRPSADRPASPLPPSVGALVSDRLPPTLPPTYARIPSNDPAPPAPVPPRSSSAETAPVARDRAERTGPPLATFGTRELGLAEVQAQYRAYVRQKIWQINDRNKPNDWIRDTLGNSVSAVYSLTIARDGQILALTLIRPSGFDVLDRAGREAILLAKPFNGFPPTAGEKITFDVVIKYEPTYR